MTNADERVAFDTLIYTDCKAGQGLRGHVGLQFQARSAGADSAAMALVQGHLLYEPPANWMGQLRPAEAYPPSFAHTCNGQLATASGVYLGREANGGREGNSLTHSIVTHDVESYGMIRPAQLHGASFWTTQPAPTTTCPQVESGWEPGPFGTAEAQEFVSARPYGPNLLIALVSTLQRMGFADRRRILFIGRDPTEILHWIASATLLIPQERALAIGFKVYTTDPARASQQIVAVHPDWKSTSAQVGHDLGYVVVDLTDNVTFTKVEPSRHAPDWVSAFCTGDAYDVVDAIEVAAASRLPEEIAPIVGRCAIMREQLTETGAEILIDWLRDSPPTLLTAHRGTIVDQLTDAVDRWPPHILLGLDEVARSGQVSPDRIQPVRLALIRAELERAGRDRTVSDALPPLPAGMWRQEDQYAAERSLIEVLAKAQVSSFDAILRVASRCGLSVNIDDIADAAHRFVDRWTEAPCNYDLDEWPCGADVDAMLDDDLSARIEHDPGRAAALADQWWTLRWQRSRDMSSPLKRAVLAATIAHTTTTHRNMLVNTILTSAEIDQAPARALCLAAQTLWARVDPTHEEMAMLAERAPFDTQFHRELFRPFAGELENGELTITMLTMAHSLVARGLWRPSAKLARLLDADRGLRELARTAPDLPPSQPPPSEALLAVSAAPSRLLKAWTGFLAKLLADAKNPLLVQQILLAAPRSLLEAYLPLLDRALLMRTSDTPVVAAALLSSSTSLPPDLRDEILSALRRWQKCASGKQIKQVKARLESILPAGPDAWIAFAAADHRADDHGRLRRWTR